MPTDTCILTSKDFTILEVMHERNLGLSAPMRSLVSRKLRTATVVFGDEVAPDVATLNSRVRYGIDGGADDVRIISQERISWSAGVFLPITTLRGLALLGLREGQAYAIDTDGGNEVLVLRQVLYQPESARRDSAVVTRGAQMLRVIDGGGGTEPSCSPGPVAMMPRDPDDPGPTAA